MYSKRRRSNVAVILVRIVFIRSFLFYCLLFNHSFPTNPNKITNCFKLFCFLLQLYNYIAHDDSKNTSPPLRCCLSATQSYIEYDATRISAQFAASISRTWSQLLSSLTEKNLPLSSTLISKVSFLDTQDRHTVLNEFNRPIVPDLKKQYQLKWKKKNGPNLLLHSLFQRTAKKYPKRVAVEDSNKTMSYSELVRFYKHHVMEAL